jgi:hypothetical protein
MFKINKNNTEFIFFEAKEKVAVYKSKNNQVSKIAEFNLNELSSAVESLKKNHSEISKSKNTWLLTTRTENFEKAPLDKDEMFNFAKWKIQEIVDISMGEIYYDILTNNTIDNSFYKKYATAVIINKAHVDKILNVFAALNIPLNAIDSKESALLDFLHKEDELLNKKALSLLRIEEDRAIMCVYFDYGLAFNRTIELPLLVDFIGKESEITEEIYRLVADKLCLEIQRNIDFLDRQYGVQYFENIIYSLPRNSILVNLETEISQYFNVKTVNLYKDLIYKSADEEIIPIEVLAGFERGSTRSENINLIPKVEKATAFNDDFKKVAVLSLLVGLGIASVGSYYENKANSTKELQTNLKSEKEKIQKDLQELKSELAGMNNPLEKEIDNLTRNKNEIIKMHAISLAKNHQSYNKIMKDIAIKAKNAGVLLTNIKYDDNGLMLIGTVDKEEIFTSFLNNLQQAETLKGKSLNLISLQKNENNFEFKVASENIGA